MFQSVYSVLSYAWYIMYCAIILSITAGVLFTSTFVLPEAKWALPVRSACAQLLLNMWAVAKVVGAAALPCVGWAGYMLLWAGLSALQAGSKNAKPVDQVVHVDR